MIRRRGKMPLLSHRARAIGGWVEEVKQRRPWLNTMHHRKMQKTEQATVHADTTLRERERDREGKVGEKTRTKEVRKRASRDTHRPQ